MTYYTKKQMLEECGSLDKVDWLSTSMHQKLSEDFIREFKDEVNWDSISMYQKLSEDFIREFKDEVYWAWISIHQKLSEDFIREFKDKVDWYYISSYQKLSEGFIMELKDSLNMKVINAIKDAFSKINPKKDAIEYAKKYNLKYDENYIYGYRKLKGEYTPHGSYGLGVYYRDWHCDPRKDQESSFGFGLWGYKFKGDHLCKVKLEDFVVYTGKESKARVWGFELLGEVE